MPSHFVWQRQRAEHHGGAQRQYGDQDHPYVPRGPWASPISCALCNRGATLGQGARRSSTSRGFSAPTPTVMSPLPFAFSLSVEKTPPRAKASCGNAVETKKKPQLSSRCTTEQVPSRCRLSCLYYSFMQYIDEFFPFGPRKVRHASVNVCHAQTLHIMSCITTSSQSLYCKNLNLPEN